MICRPMPVLLLLLLSAGCAAAEGSESRVDAPLEVTESREVVLAYLRFDVTNYEERLTLDDLRRLPTDVRERLWLLDLDLTSGPNSPRLIDNALAAIRSLDPETLDPAERNMQTLLRMTPDTANLQGTSFETIIGLAPLLGVAPEQVLADLFARNVEDPFLDDTSIAKAIVSEVIASHPNAQTRLGARTADNPEGVYPVTPGTLPVSLTDLITDFATYEHRFGPYDREGRQHPGFIAETEAAVITDDFAIAVRANANALPYRGIDLGTASTATVSSIGSQIEDLFDFEDPGWLRVEGLVEGEPTIGALSFRIVEHPTFVAGGSSPHPKGIGDSEAWQLPPWTLESVVIEASRTAFADLSTEIVYTAAGEDEPLFEAFVLDGFKQISVRGGIGSPPEPSYLWDSLLEVAQVRLHDGDIEEGDADLLFTLRDVPLGATTAELEDHVRENLRESPRSLLQLTETVLPGTTGEADIYYYRARGNNPEDARGDWLYFITESDIARDEEGELVRPYAYERPGFFSDPELTDKVSAKRPLDGDTAHEKVRLEDHPTLYVEDAEGAVFRLDRVGKPSQNRISLAVERIR